ncbi:MAG: hypothetical protein J6W63_05170 [Treponema sp.]|nr:hypothetical protein [Treponema sp.]
MADYECREQDDGTFDTRKVGASRNQSNGDGKQDSWLTAQALAHNSGGGTVTQYDRNGNVIRSKDVD